MYCILCQGKSLDKGLIGPLSRKQLKLNFSVKSKHKRIKHEMVITYCYLTVTILSDVFKYTILNLP